MSRGLGITLAVVAVLLLAVLMVFGSYVTARNQMVAKDQVSRRPGRTWMRIWSAAPT